MGSLAAAGHTWGRRVHDAWPRARDAQGQANSSKRTEWAAWQAQHFGHLLRLHAVADDLLQHCCLTLTVESEWWSKALTQ